MPLDGDGNITLQAFAAGFLPHRETFDGNMVNDPPVATGNCGTTKQAETFSGILSATDPDADLLMYSLYADGSGGSGPIFTAKGGMVTITDPTTGAFTYQPGTAAGGKRGSDSFAFQVSDLDGLTSSATEQVIVNQTIMPLGDSITSGTDGDGLIPETKRTGYRRDLQDMLTGAGYTFDFVGGDTKGSAAVPGFDYNNEGHGGWSAAELRDGGGPIDSATDGTDEGTFGWLEDNPADIVLLHAGTNGLTAGGTNADDVANSMNSIIGKIREWENSANGNPVTVVLALIIDQAPFGGLDVEDFNVKLGDLAIQRILAGEDIILVDQYAALTYPNDVPDDTHPNTDGYSKMAGVWSDVLTDDLTGVIDKCP